MLREKISLLFFNFMSNDLQNGNTNKNLILQIRNIMSMASLRNEVTCHDKTNRYKAGNYIYKYIYLKKHKMFQCTI